MSASVLKAIIIDSERNLRQYCKDTCTDRKSVVMIPDVHAVRGRFFSEVIVLDFGRPKDWENIEYEAKKRVFSITVHGCDSPRSPNKINLDHHELTEADIHNILRKLTR